jgi:hypothetical protein
MTPNPTWHGSAGLSAGETDSNGHDQYPLE